MIKPINSQSTSSEMPLGMLKSSLFEAIKPLHWVGYGLLILALFNLIEGLIPLDFLNPVWELQSIGVIVEQAPLILVGLFIVFLVDRDTLNLPEQWILTGLSWLTLVIGVVYWLLIPLGVSDTLRTYHQTNQEIAAQVQEQQQQIQQVRHQLNQAENVDELTQLLNSLRSSGIDLEINDVAQLEQTKQKLAEEITKGEQTLVAQAQQAKSEQAHEVLKKSVKWNLGALVSGTLLISVWKGTRWAR